MREEAILAAADRRTARAARQVQPDVTQRPILFSGPMVRAIRDGKKTQTRRVIKPQLPEDATEVAYWWHGELPEENSAPAGVYYHTPSGLLSQKCPYGKPGDQLWVRETWAYTNDYDGNYLLDGRKALYRADEETCIVPSRWRPSIHMPRRISRITLDISDVRVERVQDISEDDALAEGVTFAEHPKTADAPFMYDFATRFRWLWNSINEARGYGWDSNPWVWVVTFTSAENNKP